MQEAPLELTIGVSTSINTLLQPEHYNGQAIAITRQAELPDAQPMIK